MRRALARLSSPLAVASALVVILALAVRGWALLWITDFWGDSYHHWLIARLTLDHGGAYTDYKGLQVVWPPLYHYLSIFAFWVSGRLDILPLHLMNVALGALACLLAARLAYRLYASTLAAFAAGGVLAFSTWHIAFSAMNVAEVFSGVLILFLVLLLVPASSTRGFQLVPLFLLALAMPLTRTDLTLYLGLAVLWLLASRGYAPAFCIVAGTALALGGWSAWSWFNTGDPLHWYRQYAENNLHDWLLLNQIRGPAWAVFSDYLYHLSPLVLPALLAGLASLLDARAERRRALWLVTLLLAGHSLFLILGYARGIVPLLTERYLALDLPMVAVLAAAFVPWVGGMGRWAGGRARGVAATRKMEGGRARGIDPTAITRIVELGVAAALVVIVIARFAADIPELEIRRWGIDPEWQVGNFLYAQVAPGDVVLTDAPVAIYRSGKPVEQFISSVELARAGTGPDALRARNVRWVVTQAVSYDAASAYIPAALLESGAGGVVDGLDYELAWRYDPTRNGIQTEVWRIRQVAP